MPPPATAITGGCFGRGNRRINRVLHTMAIVQLRHDTQGRRYFDRKKAAGKSSMEALRALKRRLSDVVYHQMVVDDEVRRFGLEPPEGSTVGAAAKLLAQESEVVVDLVAVLDDGVVGDAVEEAPVTGPGGQVGATTGSSATGSDPDAGSSEKSLPDPRDHPRPVLAGPARPTLDIEGCHDRAVADVLPSGRPCLGVFKLRGVRMIPFGGRDW